MDFKIHEDPRAWSLTDLRNVGSFMRACRRSHCGIKLLVVFKSLHGVKN